MSNSIEYAKKFVPIIDDIYKAASVTEGMDAATKADFSGVNEVKVLKVSTTGLGDYSRENGYPKGDVTAQWETMVLEIERGKEISVDRMDDEETLGRVFGEVVGKFMRDHVVPEMDAYRFAKYAGSTGVGTGSATLTSDTIIAAVDEAVRVFDEEEVNASGRVLYVNSDLKPILNQALNRAWASDASVRTIITEYNDIPIKYVPKKRFYNAITLNSGTENWGFEPGENAKAINFMLVDKEAILQTKKFALPKIFTPDVNQDKDAWKFQYRLYHDCYVYENKRKGVYVHTNV